MSFLELFAIGQMICMIVYAARAACEHQYGAKRNMMRTMATAAIILLLVGGGMAVASAGHRFAAVREILILGIIASAFSVGASIRLMKRSLSRCDKRDQKLRTPFPGEEDPLVSALRYVRRLFGHTRTRHHGNGQ